MGKKQPISNKQPTDLLKDVNESMFFGLNLDEKQKIFRDAILDPKNICVMANAKAGTGKTTIAVAAGLYMCGHGIYDKIVYIFSPCREKDIGYRPGTTEEKMQSYVESLYNALIELGQQPEKVICNAMNQKNDTAMVEAIPHTFLRGVNLKNKFIIVEECQNYPFSELKKTLTRIHDTSKVVCIGHTGQIDIPVNGDSCAFKKYLDEAEKQEFAQVCELDVNYRGKFSQWADNIDFT